MALSCSICQAPTAFAQAGQKAAAHQQASALLQRLQQAAAGLPQMPRRPGLLNRAESLRVASVEVPACCTINI